jgi:hypothetical protein
MAAQTGLAPGVSQSILDALCRSVAWTEPAAFYVKLHTGQPLADGSGSAAANTTRQEATFSAAGADGTITTSADVTWTNVSNAETYSHVSFWSASTAGTFLGSDALETPRTVAVGDTFTIAAGDIDISLTPIATSA